MPINRFSNKPLPVSVRTKAVKVETLEYPRTKIRPVQAFVISLPKAKKRLSATLASYKKSGCAIPIETVSAIDGMKLEKTDGVTIRPGDYGCLLSHVEVIKTAKERQLECILVLEDDVEFIDGFQDRLNKAMSELPDNWDMLWLGGLPREKNEPYSDSLDRMFGSWGTYGYVIRNTMYLTVLRVLSEQPIKYSVDDYYGRLHSKHNSFRTKVGYVIHTGEVSDRKIINTIKADE